VSDEPAGGSGPAEQLLACYRRIDRATAALRSALDADDLDRLPALADERAALLAEATALLEQAAGRSAASTSGGASIEWEAALAAGRRAMEEDERLRALLASRAQQIPNDLARLRRGRGALRGYADGPATPDSVDRRA
jgi:hypothetical protein